MIFCMGFMDFPKILRQLQMVGEDSHPMVDDMNIQL